MIVSHKSGVVTITDKGFYAQMSEKTYQKILEDKDEETVSNPDFDSIIRRMQHCTASESSNAKLGKFFRG